MKKNHQFHLVDPSPWPLLISIILVSITSLTTMMLNTKKNEALLMMITIMIWTMGLWWRDIHRESTFQGNHTMSVVTSMKYGMILFITSEILLFMSLFWSFFHHSLAPNQEIGLTWPPVSIYTFNPLSIPLVNTLILLISGISITWTHSSMCNNNFANTKNSLTVTILLGLYFSVLQLYEYLKSPFSISDSVYGSSFFLTTGFHGMHVIIGTLFLIHAMTRMIKLHFNKTHHLGLELAIWYWHFVDVVWLFLYTSIYWWGK
uniref:Cytochrome c oxidase subunit 3 n=1 Tax=Lanthanaphalara mira TaxID=2218050 RepID=A0A344A2G2_9HEMI|nr:cytochrome c oxidase subunit 3 [Lanthanaphalara mira]AWU48953.1 cytochrome c oxidase subunit 3 [Lanthanaphalara mira]